MHYYQQNPDHQHFTPPEMFGPALQSWFDSKHKHLGITVRQQDEMIDRNDTRCIAAPLGIFGDMNLEELALYDEDFLNLVEGHGYYNEMHDRYSICLWPLDEDIFKKYVSKFDAHLEQLEPSPQCQQNYETSIAIMAACPSTDYTGPATGLYQFTWVRFRDYILTDKGELSREVIIDSEPHTLHDLEAAHEAIRQLPCVANVWYNLD